MKYLNEIEQELVVKFTVYAKNLAREFHRKRKNLGIEFEEFESAAYLGLCEAAINYDESQMDNFKTFSYLRIRGAMYDLLRKGQVASRRAFNKLVDNVSNEGRSDAKYKLPYTFAFEQDELISVIASVDNFAYQVSHSEDRRDLELTYRDELSPEEVLIEKDSKAYLRQLISELGEVERQLIWEHYYNDRYFSEISTMLGNKSRSWVSRKHYNVLESLRETVSQNESRIKKEDLVQ